jgi:hypothetical protein
VQAAAGYAHSVVLLDTSTPATAAAAATLLETLPVFCRGFLPARWKRAELPIGSAWPT